MQHSAADGPVLDPDREILARAASGDARAFSSLSDRHANRLYRLAYSMLGSNSDAEDVLQETLIGAYRSAKNFEGRSTVRTWLTRILMTQVTRFRRDQSAAKRKKAQPLEHAESSATLPGGAGGVEAGIDLQAALAKLSDEHREVLVLREFDGLSYDEMAAVLGVPRGTVESRLHRARAELKSKMPAYLT